MYFIIFNIPNVKLNKSDEIDSCKFSVLLYCEMGQKDSFSKSSFWSSVISNNFEYVHKPITLMLTCIDCLLTQMQYNIKIVMYLLLWIVTQLCKLMESSHKYLAQLEAQSPLKSPKAMNKDQKPKIRQQQHHYSNRFQVKLLFLLIKNL